MRLSLTPAGDATLAALSVAHLEELTRLRGSFSALWQAEDGVPPAT